MDCIQYLSEERLSLCQYVPSRCNTCNVFLMAIEKALKADDEDTEGIIINASSIIEGIPAKLLKFFKNVKWNDPSLLQWLFNIRSGSRLSFKEFSLAYGLKPDVQVPPNLAITNRNVAINIMTEMGWTWVDNVNFVEVETDNDGIKGILDVNSSLTYFPPMYEKKIKETAVFFKLNKQVLVRSDFSHAERIRQKRSYIKAAFGKETEHESRDPFNTTLTVENTKIASGIIKDPAFTRSLEKWVIPSQTGFSDVNVLHVTAKDDELSEFNNLMCSKGFTRATEANISGLNIKKASKETVDRLNESRNEVKSLNTVLVGTEALCNNSINLIQNSELESSVAENLKTSIEGIKLLSSQLVWPFKNALTRFSRNMKACRRSAIGNWQPGIAALDNLVNKKTLQSEIFPAAQQEKCEESIHDSARTDGKRILALRYVPRGNNRGRRFFRPGGRGISQRGGEFNRGDGGNWRGTRRFGGRFRGRRGQFRDGGDRGRGSTPIAPSV